jgi:ionotropic glutamate receptor
MKLCVVLLYTFIKQKVDGSARFIIETSERKKLADFSYFMWAEPFAMVVPRPGEEPRLFAFVRPFQLPVNNCTIVSKFHGD